jgi:metal-responsive CopG/Arc/MetJ family transcriptional regulator
MDRMDRNQIVGFRATRDFTKKFDELCARLGHNRSSVVRYALNNFMRNHWNNSENFKRVREEMY